MAADLGGVVNKLEALVTRLESVAVRAEGRGASADDDNANVQAFDDQIMGGKLKDYFRLSTEIGGDVKEHAQLLKEGFNILRGFLVASAKYKQPADLQKTLKPLADVVEKVQVYAEKKRNTTMNNHLQTLKEAVPVLGWVSVPKPANYIKEIKDQAMFYGNRVVKDYKGKDEKHVEWWRALCGSLAEMVDFVKDCYPIGLTWNAQGQPYVASATAPPPPTGGAPPPPPPPVVLPPTDYPSSKEDGDQAARSNLFATLNQGTEITKGLKKVTKDMQTHKNPDLRGGALVPNAKPTPASKPVAPAGKKTGPPRCVLEGKKWIVEYQSNRHDVVVMGDQRQTAYIYKCDNSTIHIKGKLNSIVMDSCSKVGVVVADVISTVDFINCQRVKGQVTGTVPCLNIDKTDGIEIYLSKESINAEIITAKSSAMNILVPKDDDFVEHPLPEQFKAKWNGKGFTTTTAESV